MDKIILFVSIISILNTAAELNLKPVDPLLVVNENATIFIADDFIQSSNTRDVQFEGANIETTAEGAMAPITANGVYSVPQNFKLDGSLKVVGNEQVVKVVVGIYLGPFQVLSYTLSPAGTYNLGDGYNRLTYITEASLNAGDQYTLSRAVILVTTNLKRIQFPVPGPITINVAQ